MSEENHSKIVAEKARETFLKIRELRKMMPQFTRAEKDALNAEIKKLQDQWWEDVRGYMTHPMSHFANPKSLEGD